MCCTCRKYGFNDGDVGRELSRNRIRSKADLSGGIDARARNNETKVLLVIFVSRAKVTSPLATFCLISLHELQIYWEFFPCHDGLHAFSQFLCSFRWSQMVWLVHFLHDREELVGCLLH